MINRFFWISFLAFSLQASWGYSPAGPVANGGDSWQTANQGFGGLYAPKNIGEEFRRNTPVMFYAYDANFLNYFGPEGAASVDAAFALLNTNLVNVDAFSKSLSEVPLQTRDVNYRAQALGLIDLKSYTLSLMMVQLGLADPVRYSWVLHNLLGDCSNGHQYLVVQRNLDIISTPSNQLQYSPYVNDILYSYTITDFCSQGQDAATTTPFSVDPLAAPFAPIAASSPFWGEYFTGLTRDDVAGLRYLLTTNNVNFELPASGVLTVTTNFAVQVPFPQSISPTNGILFNGTLFGTASYGALVAFSKTNDPGTVENAFPGVQVTLVSNFLATVTTTNFVSYFTNFVGEPLGTPAHLVTNTTYSTSIVSFFVETFDNIVTNIVKTNTVTTIQNINIAPLTGAPVGSPLATNITTQTATINVPFADFFILPTTNGNCGVDIVSTVTTFTNYVTNLITFSSTTNNNTSPPQVSSFTQLQIIPSISHVYSIHPVSCDQASGTPGLYQGVESLRFVRADFDSLLGQFWQPVTNDYAMVLVTNSKAVVQQCRRVVTSPDFLLSAADLISSGQRTSQNVNFNFSLNANTGLAGPGTIDPVTVITYDKGSPAYFNNQQGITSGFPYFDLLPGGNGNDFFSKYFVWASFDGTTNAPVIFPNGTSIDDLQNQMLVRVSPTSLPFGIANLTYPLSGTVNFTAVGGAFTPPFTWSENAGVLSGIGLTLSPDGSLSGVPTQSGTFDFILTLTDVNARTVNFNYSITIQ